MTDLPTGTVTFLFTDIEGSTNLARSLGPRWPDVLEEHHEILRSAIREHAGVIVRTEGDAFFAVFSSAVDAVAGATTAQRALAAHEWPADGPIWVRMGMHTGEGRPSGDDYAGLDVHRAARIAAAGHGGQVLLSEATRALVADSPPDGVGIQDLGPHRLKDFDEPQPIHQLVIEGVPSAFPGLKTLDVPTNLPVQLTTFLGRTSELAEIEALLGTVRLLTLVGPGGSGKTRLALETGARQTVEHRDGVFFVDLSPIRDPGLVPTSIIQSLGLMQRPDRPPVEILTGYLRGRHTLLVLDNFEQVLDAAPLVEEILRGASKVKVVATSRTRLGLMGEQAFPVPPLSVPDARSDVEALTRNEAVALFRDRARAVLPSFEITAENAPTIAEVCVRLDGLPLAIELAAAQMRLLTPAELLRRLEHRLPLRTEASNVPERQRTLRGAIEWSYDLLAPPERNLFARLSVFAGGATASAVDAVGNPESDIGVDTIDALTSLFDASLVRREDFPEGSRFLMLETIREYASERLQADFDAEATRRRHAEFMGAFVLEWGPVVRSLQTPHAADMLSQDHDNVRAAIAWCLEKGAAELGLRIVAPMWMFWVEQGHIAEGIKTVQAVLSLADDRELTARRASALVSLGALVYWQGDYVGSARAYEDALDLYRRIGDDHGVMRAGNDLIYALLAQRAWEAALPLIEERLEAARAAGNEAFMAELLGLLGIARAQREDYEGALEAYRESLALFERRPGSMTVWVGEAKGRIGAALRLMGRLDEAEEAMLEGLRSGRRLAGNLAGVATARQVGAVAWDRGDYERALTLFGFAEVTAERIGGPPPSELIHVQEPAWFREQARAHLDDETIDRLWVRGRAMSLDDGIDFMIGQQP